MQITFSQLREQALEFYKAIEAIRVQREGETLWERTSMSEILEIQKSDFPDFPASISDNFLIEGPLINQQYGQWEYSSGSAEIGLKFLKDPVNRLKTIYWRAMIMELGRMSSSFIHAVSTNQYVFYARGLTYGQDESKESNVMNVLRLIASAKPTKDTLKESKKWYDDWVNRLEAYQNLRNPKPDTGLAKVLTSGPSGGRDWSLVIESQIQEMMKQLPSNGLASRTWGFEIESPDCKGVTPLPGSGIDKGDDGSLRSYESNDECECDCRDCTYHECDCDNCDMYNDSPDHCGDDSCSTAESAEYRSTGGIQRVKHNGMYDLCQKLLDEDAEMNDSAGTHIHVWAADLTTNQVGQVMAGYKRLENIFSVLCGRDDVQYARRVAVEHVRAAIKSSEPKLKMEKPRAVNICNVTNDRGTIEFRQMDCNYDADRITFFAWVVRGLVETAKRGASLESFVAVQDVYDLVKMFGKFNYFIASETPALAVPGTKTDMSSIKKATHKVA